MLIIVTKELATVGTKVVRGRDWHSSYKNQDENSDYGVIVGKHSLLDNWIRVNWMNGNGEKNYRVGVGGSYDLYLYDEESNRKPSSSFKYKAGDLVRAVGETWIVESTHDDSVRGLYYTLKASNGVTCSFIEADIKEKLPSRAYPIEKETIESKEITLLGKSKFITVNQNL